MSEERERESESESERERESIKEFPVYVDRCFLFFCPSFAPLFARSVAPLTNRLACHHTQQARGLTYSEN